MCKTTEPYISEISINPKIIQKEFIMKRKSCFALALLFVFMTVLGIFSRISVSAEDVVYNFTYTDKDIVLDGKTTGEDWDAVEWTDLKRSGGNGEEKEGFSARFKGMWKEIDGVKYVYFFLDVIDPNKSTINAWNGDAFYVAVNYDGTQRYTPTLNMLTAANNTNIPGTNNINVIYTSVDTREADQHFIAEGKLPVADATSFFFDILVQDEYESVGTYYTRYAWNNITQNNVAPTGIGKLVTGADVAEEEFSLVGEDDLGRYHIYNAVGNLTIDGQASSNEPWDAVQWTSAFKRNVTASSGYMVQEYYSAKMKVLWQRDEDNAYLYFLIVSNDSTTSFDLQSWVADCFKILIDEDANGTLECSPAAVYIPVRQGYTAPFDYVVDDRRALGDGYTIEARYKFKNIDNCSGSVKIDAMVQDFAGSSAQDTSGTCYSRYAWRDTAGADSANGIGVISDVPVFAVNTAPGAAIRIDTANPHMSGIRFQTTVDAAVIASLEAAGATVTTGTLLLPTSTLTSKGVVDFTKENLVTAGLEEEVDFYDIVNIGNGWVDGLDGMYYGTLYGIKNFQREFSGVGYVRVDLGDGKVYTIYGGYTADNARSVAQVAQMALDDPGETFTEAQRNILENFISGGTLS